MPLLWTRLRRATRQSARRLRARHALGRDSGRLGLPRLRGAREARLPEAGILKGLLLALAALAIAGCSGLKLGYNRADWIASWQLGRFVDLDREQEQLFVERFREFWHWHRSTQLALYARDLRELQALVDKPLSAAQVQRYLESSQAHLGRALQEIVPDTARVLRTFDDQQVAELLENMAEKRRERAEESARLSAEELREEAEDQMKRTLKRWIGPVNREQQRRIGEWAAERQYAGTVWHQYQEAWASAFTEVLAHRREADFERHLAELFDHGRVPYRDEMDQVERQNRKAWIGLMADLSASLDDKQRRHLRARLAELAADFEELAGQARAASPPAATPTAAPS